MNFFFDATFPPDFTRALDILTKNHTVKPKRDFGFKANTPDEKWIKYLGEDEEDWIILSADIAILSNPHQRKALLKSGCTIFVFKSPFTEHER